MKFTYHKVEGKVPRWLSDDGNYSVWRQARLLNGEVEWAAEHPPMGEWLTQHAGSRKEAIEVCREHAEGKS